MRAKLPFPSQVIQSAVVPGTTVAITVYINSDLRYVALCLNGYVLGDPTAEIIINTHEADYPTEDGARAAANVSWIMAIENRNARRERIRRPADMEIWDPFQDNQLRKISELASAPVEITEGFWSIGERIFKVQRSQTSGYLYAKELTSGGWSYLPGAMSELKEQGSELTAKTAERYGKLYGVCAICGRALTNEESIEAGIGPVCRARMGW